MIQIVNGFAPTGAALVSAGVDKLIFVGSVAVGRAVMKGARNSNDIAHLKCMHMSVVHVFTVCVCPACAEGPKPITPLVLELGGKDPFIICEDVAITPALLQLACRGTPLVQITCARAQYDIVRSVFVSTMHV